MGVVRRLVALGLVWTLVPLLASGAGAGVRVTGPAPPPPAPPADFRPWYSLQFGFGVTGDDAATGPGGAIALESAIRPYSHLLLRVDYFRISQREVVFLFPLVLEGALTTLEGGVRLCAEGRTARSYVDAMAGAGFATSVLSIGPYVFREDDVRALLGTGLGASWMPPASPIGVFAEGRINFLLGDPSAHFQSARAGLVIRGPRLMIRGPLAAVPDSSALRRGRSIARPRGGGP